MTFLLQKFNAITRTEARARNGLRSSASGIAFTGRLAVCLLIAGFLGVGSAMAQTPPDPDHVLRMGGGAIVVPIGKNQVHHYLTDTDADGDLKDEKPTAAGTNPTAVPSGGGTPATPTFLIGGLALVTHTVGASDDPNTLTVSPIGTGIFKIAVSPNGEAAITTAAGSNNMGTPYAFEVLSGNAPMLTDISGAADAYNAGASSDAVMLSLTPRDDASEEYKNINTWFSDPDDVFLEYDAEVDKVERCDKDRDANMAGCQDADGDPGKTKMVDVATATISGTTLTVALNANAKSDSSDTDVWVIAMDASGEYARKRIDLTTGSPTNPYVVTALEDKTLREDDKEETYTLHMAFDDPDVASTTRFNNAVVCDMASLQEGCAVDKLTYAVKTSDANAEKDKVKTGADAFTLVTSYMIADVTEGATASIAVTPRDVASIMVTVTATDKGVVCRLDNPTTTVDDRYTFTAADPNATPATVDRCLRATAGTEGTDNYVAADSTGIFPDPVSVSDTFMLSIISKTTPKTDKDIEDQEIKAADGDAITFDLEDLNGDKDGEPMAFEDPTEGGLTYALEAKQVKDDDIASISVDGSMVTISPEWWAGGKDGSRETDVEVIATNTLDEASQPRMFKLKVGTATKPVVNPEVEKALAAIGGMFPELEVAAGKSLAIDLTDVSKVKGIPPAAATALKGEPLLIDPNAATAKQGEGLPGGLLYKVQVKDVEAQHRYDDLSRENHVVTSAGTVMLDPSTAMLTITGTAPNYMNVTVWGIDREQDKISATMMFVVPEVTSAEGEELPTEVELSQNYPNPFNPQTTIDYALPQAGDVSLVVYDMLGREVDVLLDGPQAAGRHTVRFGANHLPNGAYVYRLVAGDKTITRTMVLVK